MDMEGSVLITGANKGACGEVKDEAESCIGGMQYVSGYM